MNKIDAFVEKIKEVMPQREDVIRVVKDESQTDIVLDEYIIKLRDQAVQGDDLKALYGKYKIEYFLPVTQFYFASELQEKDDYILFGWSGRSGEYYAVDRLSEEVFLGNENHEIKEFVAKNFHCFLDIMVFFTKQTAMQSYHPIYTVKVSLEEQKSILYQLVENCKQACGGEKYHGYYDKMLP